MGGGGRLYSKLHFNQNLFFRRYMAVLFARFRNLVILAWLFWIKLEDVSIVINVFSITSPWRSVWFFLCTNLNPLHWRMLYVCKFVNWHWPDGFGEDKNVKSLQTDNRQTDTTPVDRNLWTRIKRKGKKDFLSWNGDIFIHLFKFLSKIWIPCKAYKPKARKSHKNNEG